MRLLLDTHAWLWSVAPSDRLSGEARSAIENPLNEVIFSTASAWEISIKYGVGRLHLPAAPDSYIPSRISMLRMTTLRVELAHACAVHSLPLHHRDPFDRLLIAQAIVEGLTIVTADAHFSRYDVALLKT
ncbi:MAG: type II toxin-antitoxin system VapC family toxin [Candidatus Eremiobacteraeota bacterium]|nr:type II toxin-antitoxin system VapC family toxin [Candidatus Eremiobacteraeota bacterium]MBC5804212.1 type II toxin-antitoxin system VapC family toxin [Candidatus Eremiobacteraeota bacterium]MBC5822588.1 type II toxin-antitoxin system VapC family toxin [Candidatus Eremiobacteraeota bacterium]